MAYISEEGKLKPEEKPDQVLVKPGLRPAPLTGWHLPLEGGC